MALTLTFCVLGYTLWQNFWWRLSVDYIAGEAGTAQAMSEFHKGRLILWEIDPTNNFPRFSGKYDGPFEIWLDEYNPEMSYPWQYMQRRRDEANNAQMRLMNQNRVKFRFGVDAGVGSTNNSSN